MFAYCLQLFSSSTGEVYTLVYPLKVHIDLNVLYVEHYQHCMYINQLTILHKYLSKQENYLLQEK